MNETDIRAQLVRKRNEIFGRVQRLHGDIHARAQPYSPDFSEQAIELESLDVLFEIDAASRRELNLINNTLERIDSGRYGLCNRCGGPIGKARLAALPYAETCIDCAS